jgi:ketosteroid isomerase-like protein
MSAESTTPDLVERVRRQAEAANRRDIDAVMTSFAVDAVFEGRALGDIFEGQAAIRAFVEGWFGMYEELEYKLEEVHDLGNGVVFAVVFQEARPVGIAGHVRQREGWVYVWVEDLIARLTISDIDEARVAAERLADERGKAMSQKNVETVERAIAAINARDLDGYLACCTENVELLLPMVGAEYLGAGAIRRFFTDIDHIGPDFRIDVQSVQAVGDNNVIAFMRTSATGRASGIATGTEGQTNVYDFADDKIKRVRIFLDRSEAHKAVGLIE